MNLNDIRTQLQAAVEMTEREVADRQAELDSALNRLAIARKERDYWDEVRTADEILQLCLQPLDGRVLPSVPAKAVERDGKTIYICMATHPCPMHGRPVAGSDWRLHSTRRSFAEEQLRAAYGDSDPGEPAVEKDHVADAVAEGRDALESAHRFIDRLATVARDMGASDTVIAGITQRWDSFANRVEARLTEEENS